VEAHLQTRISQAQRLHQEFAPTLKVVIIVKRNLQTPAWAPVILFSRALDLPDDLWRDDDCLRFQIEVNVRDAQQDWGLEDFMNGTETAVTHAANLALCMVNVSPRLRRDLRQSDPASGILDLKAQCRGYKYVSETIKLLPEKPASVLLTKIFAKVTCLGRIHAVLPSFSPG
jgi:putative transposase